MKFLPAMQLRPTQSILPREQVPGYAAKPFPTQFHKIVKPICLNPGACNRHIGSGRDERGQRWKRGTARPGVEDAKRPESRIRQQREESPVRAAQSVCIAPLGLHLNPSPTRGSGARYRGRPSPPATGLLRHLGGILLQIEFAGIVAPVFILTASWIDSLKSSRDRSTNQAGSLRRSYRALLSLLPNPGFRPLRAFGAVIVHSGH